MSKVVVSTKPLRGKHIPTLQKIMEISKSLQEEILSVQNKLKNAIRDHQICVEKLKDEPKNTKILEQIQQIQIYIVSLGRRQKQVVQRLRMEVETLKAENANGSKVSVASLLGLNNNNHINNNNEAKEETTDSKKINGLVNAIKKEDYEEEIRNTDNSSPSQENDDSNRERSNSVETISYEDDVVEISGDENSSEKQDMEEEFSVESSIQVSFLGTLGLITTTKSIELQNRKTERKRRSTANPQFVYSNWELPTKRKRHSYLQSAGKAPQTRQSTARSVGPSPPPGKILFNKSLPPSTKNASKTLISTQKLAAKPNILRNGSENKAFNKNGTENAQLQNNKSIASKVVHIPGLPSSLTIERIEADSAVCISCRNPGTLTVCQQCSSNYHISCHSTSPPPPKICPSCVLNSKENTSFPGVIKKENELAATAYTARGFGKAREDAKVNKASRGLHQIDAATKRSFFASNIGINQLPSSTYLIPISTNSMRVPDHTIIDSPINGADSSEIRIIDQFTHSGNITYINKPEAHFSNYPCQDADNRDKHQSYLVVKKGPEPTNTGERSFGQQFRIQNNTILNYQLSSPCGYSTTHGKPELPLAQRAQPSNWRPEADNSRGKKPNKRSLPGLNRICPANNKQHESDSSPTDEETGNDQQDLSRFGDLFHSLLAVNNNSDIIAGSSNESQGAGGADYSDYWHLSQKQQSTCDDRTKQPRRIKPANSAEHVKLEEAHLSAPSRTKLNSTKKVKRLSPNKLIPLKKGNKSKQTLKSKPAGKAAKKNAEVEAKPKVSPSNSKAKKNVIQPVMEVTLDDTDETGSDSSQESVKETEIICNNKKQIIKCHEIAGTSQANFNRFEDNFVKSTESLRKAAENAISRDEESSKGEENSSKSEEYFKRLEEHLNKLEEHLKKRDEDATKREENKNEEKKNEEKKNKENKNKENKNKENKNEESVSRKEENVVGNEEDNLEKEIMIVEDKTLPSFLRKEDCQVSEDLQNFYTLVKVTLDFIISERNHSGNQIGECANKNACFERLQDEVIELHDEVTIPDDKADSESQDLFSDNSRPLIIDEGSVSAIERFSSSPSNASSLEIKETVVIDSVSSDKIELLERFESALLSINLEIDG